MTRARKELVSVETTPYYHCICRCVRRAFLCGEDSYSGKNYEHRRGWVLERLRELQGVFAVDVCAYAVMSNHYHLVVRLDADRAAAWSEGEVMERWERLFSLQLRGQP
ncbi:transposase [Thioalkalivibrio sp. ARh3]|uniref:transposase n=1 Tax=Thioalkalivibrio sp. ARh3 TaxID=1158148 RepID=UPI00036AED24